MGRRRGIPGLSFSWKRALGITRVKQRISRQTGIPLTRAGRQRKAGQLVGCCVPLLVLTALMAATAVAAVPEAWAGKVVGVSDGDTVTVMRAGEGVKVRLHGVDTPETGQAFGSRAKQFASEQCFGKTVRVVPRDVDRYGRVVGEVHLEDGRVLNQALVSAGMAWWYRDYAKGDKTLERLEQEARAARRGLWAEAKPVAPWDWRKQQRDARAAKRGEDAKPKAPPPPAAAGRATVYTTDTGTKYHREKCRHLGQSKHKSSVNAARAKGLEPCGVCKP
jgi:endonuclease YncB( thermonuclease family)